jgi:hypothetical protein
MALSGLGAMVWCVTGRVIVRDVGEVLRGIGADLVAVDVDDLGVMPDENGVGVGR